eukprot:Sspe_Gene.91184::Locus_62652_Transcript_2_2_Confidence_0.667_Length_1408::g.91184::m.91184
MQFYERVLQRVNGALAAHFGKSLPEAHKDRILGFVYSMKYEYQLQFDQMEVVGNAANGKVEAILTPTGFVKKVRMNPAIARLPKEQQSLLVMSAVGSAKKKGRALMEKAEMQIYGHFLRDIKPWVLGLRDNPEFFTIPEDAVETPEGILAPNWLKPEHIHRTIPFEKWRSREDVSESAKQKEKEWLQTPEGLRWSNTVLGRRYLESLPEAKPRGAPGRLMTEDTSNRNIAYELTRKKMHEEFTKTKALFDMWFGSESTLTPLARAYDQTLFDKMSDEFRLRAAKVDWTATRADDRAKAKRDAQDAGLEPHFLNYGGFDLRHHWFVKRRELGAAELHDYDTARPGGPEGGITEHRQYHRKRITPYTYDEVQSFDESGRWAVVMDRSRTPLDQKGGLWSCLRPRETWQSKMALYPDAKAKF